MKRWMLGFATSLCLAGAAACIVRPPQPQPAPQVVPTTPAAASPATFFTPPLPFDDPKSCHDPSGDEDLKDDGSAVAADEEAIGTELQRRIVERSAELVACQPAARGVEEVDVALVIASDGATRAHVLGTSLADCGVVSCVRAKLTGLQIAAPRAGQHLRFRWLLAIAPQSPIRLYAPGDPAKWFGKAPESSMACLDTASATPVSGRLPPEVIRRLVREQYGRFRTCYEAGLGRHSDLTGRVTVRFVIGRDGKVSNARISEQTDLPDCGVARCIRDAFMHIEFPRPEGGIVTVQYPVMLQPG